MTEHLGPWTQVSEPVEDRARQRARLLDKREALRAHLADLEAELAALDEADAEAERPAP